MNFKNKSAAHAAMKSQGFKRREYILTAGKAWYMMGPVNFVKVILL
jgi:hypothetical protein